MFFDTETTGLPKYRDQAYKGPGNWPHIVSIAWIVLDNNFIPIKKEYFIIKPRWEIPQESVRIHGITYEKALQEGHDLKEVLDKFWADAQTEKKPLIAHNMDFDLNVLVNAELWDLGRKYPSLNKTYCTMELTRNILKLPGNYGYKNPKLSELFEFIFKKKATGLHNSLKDTELLVEIFLGSKELQAMIDLTISGIKDTNEIQNKKGTLYL
jgi:DNA polymerase III epsilon subunit-like protein